MNVSLAMTNSLTAMKNFAMSDPKLCRKWLNNVNKHARLTDKYMWQ